MTNLRIIEKSADILPEYGRIPISFEVRTVFDVHVLDHGLNGFSLSERKIRTPYVKDYDGIKGEGPTRWAKRWDLSNWGVILAFVKDVRIGGCVIAYNTPGVHKLEERTDIAVLWDMRVQPSWRGRGIGSSLLRAAVRWSKDRHCRILKAETQNINVPACRFYTKHGFTLGAVNRFAYQEFPDEVELVWYRNLRAAT
jgi:GNAT superfamily N-acetyltransferase